MKYLILSFTLLFLGCRQAPEIMTYAEAGTTVISPEINPVFSSQEKLVDIRNVDSRPIREIAQAACGARCKGSLVTRNAVLASTTATPIVPASWTVSNWYIDPANSVGCASNSNSGTSATCVGGCTGAVCASGIGPITTYAELITHRLGTQSPQYPFGQSVTFNQLSSQPLNVDSLFFTPEISGGGYAALIGT